MRLRMMIAYRVIVIITLATIDQAEIFFGRCSQYPYDSPLSRSRTSTSGRLSIRYQVSNQPTFYSLPSILFCYSTYCIIMTPTTSASKLRKEENELQYCIVFFLPLDTKSDNLALHNTILCPKQLPSSAYFAHLVHARAFR